MEKELIFEGEYLNGYKWNGKLYDIKEKKVYELHNGKGKFKEYGFGYILEGVYINGTINGKGKIFGPHIIEAEFINGKRNGKGKEYLKNGILIFEGE